MADDEAHAGRMGNERMMTDTGDHDVDGHLIDAISALPEDATLAEDGELVARLDVAHTTAIDAALTRVSARTGIEIEDDDTVRLGGLTGYRPDVEWAESLHDLLAHTLMAREDKQVLPAVLAAGELRRELTVDGLQAHRLMNELDDGWMLIVGNPAGLNTLLTELVTDIRLVFGAAHATLFYGIRSALGPPPSSAEHPRLLIQIAGGRSVLIQGKEHPTEQQHRVQTGSVVFVPRGRTATHLPLDLDSAHLEIQLPGLGASTDVERTVRCRMPVEVSSDHRAARVALPGSSTSDRFFRLTAPGGVHVVSGQSGETTGIALGDKLVGVSATGADLLVRLADGRPASAAELATELDVTTDAVESALTTLWKSELVMPVAPAAGLATNDRLTQVASGDVGVELVQSVLASIDESLWRSPNAGELPVADEARVMVQPLGNDEVIAQMSHVVQVMNLQFFGADLTGLRADDPPLIVRVQTSYAGSADLDGLVSDLLAPFSTRKITWVLALNEADGGWPVLPAGSPVSAERAGVASAWLSLRPWALSPLEDGERLFVLGRHHGAAFR